MTTRKKSAIGVLRLKKGDDRKTIYDKVRRAFSAADLQKYTENEEMFPVENLVAELEAIHREERRKRKRKKA